MIRVDTLPESRERPAGNHARTPMTTLVSIILILLLSQRAEAIAAQQTNPQPTLANAGFESPRLLDGWEIVTYGARVDVAIDDKEVHEGRQSLRVTASEASDTALGQEVC